MDPFEQSKTRTINGAQWSNMQGGLIGALQNSHQVATNAAPGTQLGYDPAMPAQLGYTTPATYGGTVPLPASASGAMPQTLVDSAGYDNMTPAKSNTMRYVLYGVGAIALIGLTVLAVKKLKA